MSAVRRAHQHWARPGAVRRSAWTPKSIGSSLKLWLRGDLGVTLNVAHVSAWADQSGNGNHTTQGVANLQPTFVASGIGGKPSLSFDGGDILDGAAALTGAANWSLFVVAQYTNTAGHLSVNVGNATTGYGASINVGASGKREILVNGVATETDGAATTSAESWLLTNSGASGPQAFYLGGVSQSLSASTATTIAPAAEFHIGARTSAGQIVMLGSIAEVVVCSAALSASDRAKLFAYSLARYGV